MWFQSGLTGRCDAPLPLPEAGQINKGKMAGVEILQHLNLEILQNIFGGNTAAPHFRLRWRMSL